MPETRTCPKCGAGLPDNAPAGICPKCLMQAALESDADAGSTPEMNPTTLTSGFVPPAPEELAKHFPQLEILELLGKGGMGAVYKARQPRLDRLVAVKILPPEIGADPSFTARFTREARALAKLSHQNIVSVFDFGEADGQYYFVMEFVDGMNLRQLIETGGLKPEEALAIVPQICEALQFAHNAGIVHRDIKPENILVDKQGRVKIADFGLAKLLGKALAEFNLTGTHQAMGTLHYMAPEQMRGAGAVDHRADIYSLGVVFYEMLTGQLPIGRFEPPSKKVHVDVRLDEIVLRSLENEPARRYQQVSEVKTAVEVVSGSSASLPAAVRVVTEAVLAQVERPGKWLFITSIVNWIGIPLLGGGIMLLISLYGSGRMRAHLPDDIESALGIVILSLLPVNAFMMFAALKMRRLEGYWMAVVSAVAAMVVSPGNLMGLPVGIWALVVLSDRDVRAAFAQRRGARVAGSNRREGSDRGKPGPSAALRTPPPDVRSATETEDEGINSPAADVKGPALGLLLTGVLGCVLMVSWAAFMLWRTIVGDFRGEPARAIIIPLAVAAVYALMIFAANRMRQLADYQLVCFFTLLAILIPPVNLVGLPIGIWALVVLSQKDVREAFRRQTDEHQHLSGDSEHGGRQQAQGLISRFLFTLSGWISPGPEMCYVIALAALLFGYVGRSIVWLLFPDLPGTLWFLALPASVILAIALIARAWWLEGVEKAQAEDGEKTATGPVSLPHTSAEPASESGSGERHPAGLSTIVEREVHGVWRWVAGDSASPAQPPVFPGRLMTLLSLAGCLMLMVPWLDLHIDQDANVRQFWHDAELPGSFSRTLYGSEQWPGIAAGVALGLLTLLLIMTPVSRPLTWKRAAVMSVIAGYAVLHTVLFKLEFENRNFTIPIVFHEDARPAGQSGTSDSDVPVGEERIEPVMRNASVPLRSIEHQVAYREGFYGSLALSVLLLVLSSVGVRHAVARGGEMNMDADQEMGTGPVALTQIRRQLKGPAIALMLYGLFILFPTVLCFTNGFDIADGNDATPQAVGFGMIALSFVLLGLAGLVIRGGWHMLAMESYRAALLASFLGQPIGLWGLLVLSRPDVKSAFGVVSQSRSGPRLSRCALAGAIWAGLGLMALILAAFLVSTSSIERSSEEITSGGSTAPPGFPLIFVMQILAVPVALAASSVFGTTICGAVAIGHIRHSGGKLYGLPLAVADVLLFPLLAMGGITGTLTHIAQIAIWTKSHTGYVYQAGNLADIIAPNSANRPDMIFLILDTLVALLVCFVAGLAAWRKIAAEK